MSEKEYEELNWGDYIILNEYAPRIRDNKNLHYVPLFVTNINNGEIFKIRATNNPRIVGNTYSLTEIKKKVTIETHPEYFL